MIIDRALALQPLVPAVRFNRDLVVTAIGRRQSQAELCRELLTGLVRFVAPVESIGSALFDIVIATRTADSHAVALCDAAALLLGGKARAVWIEQGADASGVDHRGWTTIDTASGAHPRGGAVVFVGVARSPVRWFDRCAPSAVVLVVDNSDACTLQTRIRELASDGRRRIALAYADATIAAHVRLPGATLRSESR